VIFFSPQGSLFTEIILLLSSCSLHFLSEGYSPPFNPPGLKSLIRIEVFFFLFKAMRPLSLVILFCPLPFQNVPFPLVPKSFSVLCPGEPFSNLAYVSSPEDFPFPQVSGNMPPFSSTERVLLRMTEFVAFRSWAAACFPLFRFPLPLRRGPFLPFLNCLRRFSFIFAAVCGSTESRSFPPLLW